MVAVVKCVMDGPRLRVRIVAFVDSDGKVYDDVYDTTLNCRFPRNLRVEGRTFHVPDADVKLLGGNGKAHFYSISAKNIAIADMPSAAHRRPERVFESSGECVACMDAAVDMVFVPCGHMCVCRTCSLRMRECCLCRARVDAIIPRG